MTTAASPINSLHQLTQRQEKIVKYCCQKMIPLIAKCLEINGVRVKGEKPHLQLSVADNKFSQSEMTIYVSWIQAYSDATSIVGTPAHSLAAKTFTFVNQHWNSDPMRISCFNNVMEEIDQAFPLSDEERNKNEIAFINLISSKRT